MSEDCVKLLVKNIVKTVQELEKGITTIRDRQIISQLLEDVNNDTRILQELERIDPDSQCIQQFLKGEDIA